MVDITTQQTFHVEHHGIGCFQGSGRVPYRDSKLPGATDFFAWKSLSSVCREFRSWNCWVVISIIVVVIIVDISWYIMIYHDISWYIYINYYGNSNCIPFQEIRKLLRKSCRSPACGANMDKENWYMILQCRKMALDLLWRSSNKNKHAKKK